MIIKILKIILIIILAIILIIISGNKYLDYVLYNEIFHINYLTLYLLYIVLMPISKFLSKKLMKQDKLFTINIYLLLIFFCLIIIFYIGFKAMKIEEPFIEGLFN